MLGGCTTVHKKGKEMKTGAVCYVDLLGFSYLTRNVNNKKNELIIRRCIKNFHNAVYEALKKTKIQYVTLSDSIFLYTDDEVDNLLFSLSQIFRTCIMKGVLLRGGMAYGEYDVLHTKLLGNNISGSAVTKAVEYEKRGKGCRIFTDSNFPINCELFEKSSLLFTPYTNFSDYSVLDIVEWPLINKKYTFGLYDRYYKTSPNNNMRELLLENYKIFDFLRWSPLLNWNDSCIEGTKQINSTIEYITTLIDKILECTDITDRERLEVDAIGKIKRNNETVSNLNKLRYLKIIIERQHPTMANVTNSFTS